MFFRKKNVRHLTLHDQQVPYSSSLEDLLDNTKRMQLGKTTTLLPRPLWFLLSGFVASKQNPPSLIDYSFRQKKKKTRESVEENAIGGGGKNHFVGLEASEPLLSCQKNKSL